jgi:hypothetical protein
MPVELGLVGAWRLHMMHPTRGDEGVVVVEIDAKAREVGLRVGEVPATGVRFEDSSATPREDIP